MIGRSDALQVCVVGATGLVGQALIREARGRTRFRLTAVSRREVPLPEGARLETVLAPVEEWQAALTRLAPDVVVCALGTTRARAGSEAAFRAVDFDLVLDVAKAARAAGAGHLVLVSSVGADARSRNAYLRAKGDAEAAVIKLGFRRLDIVRPGLLRGARAESRPLEWLARVLAPVMDLALVGRSRKYRSIRAAALARAILGLSGEKAGGRFMHEHDALVRAERRLGG